MGIKLNVFTGQLDFGGGSSGGGGSATAERYTKTFNNSSDWTISGSEYFQTITAATHGKTSTPNVMVFELVGSNYEEVTTVVSVNGAGDVTLKVSATPDNRFNGLVLII